MHFDSPWRLLTLAPFLALVVWLLIGLHHRVQIPFLSIWPFDSTPPKKDRRLHLPPPPILILLLAIFLSILAFAQPLIRKNSPKTPEISKNPPQISLAAIRSNQLMIRLSQPTLKPIELTLEYAQSRQTQTLNPSDNPVYFLDFTPLPDELLLTIGQSTAKLKRQGAYPLIQRQAPLGASAERAIASYESARKPSDHSPIVKISKSLSADESGVIPGKFESADDELTVTDHPITANVRSWPNSGGEVPEGWTPLVKRGQKTLVALHEIQDVRQIWIAMDFSLWDATPDFVIFWTNLLDYLAGQTSQYLFQPAVEKPTVSERIPEIQLAPWLWSSACALGLISSLLFYKKDS